MPLRDRDGEDLGIIKLNLDGDQCVRQLDTNNKLDPMEVEITNEAVRKNINESIKWYESVFKRIGGVKVDPIHVLLNEI